MQKLWLFMCLSAVLGSQGVVVKCTAAIFFRTVDFRQAVDQHAACTVGLGKVLFATVAVTHPNTPF